MFSHTITGSQLVPSTVKHRTSRGLRGAHEKLLQWFPVAVRQRSLSTAAGAVGAAGGSAELQHCSAVSAARALEQSADDF